MKRIWLILLITGYLFASCNDFLDVTSDNEILESELFSDYSGMRMAVNGIYRTLSSTDLYGKNMTWGFASAIGHNYQSTSTSYLPTDLYYAAQFEWENSYVKSTTEEIWSTAYNVISTCNNIIQQVSVKDTSFFEIGLMEKNMILGEMYGIRAMLHFDLYRLFVPAPATNYSGTAIPYVKEYPTHQPIHNNANDVMTWIVEDMELAKKLLGEVDTTYCRSWNTGLTGRIRQSNSWTTAPPNEFMSYRGMRMNYWGATALLARIYLYFGNMEKAYENAQVIYKFHQRNWFRWTSASYQGLISSVDYIHPKRPEEILMCFSNNDNYDNWESAIGTSNYMFRIKNATQLFEGDEDDYRKVGWYNRYGYERYLTWIRPTGTSYNATSIAESQGPLLPIISFPEMYHVLVECLINQGNIGEAVELLNKLRKSRGLKTTILEDVDIETLNEILKKDIIRETLTSGQTFFLFKRLNQNIYNGDSDIVMEASSWIIPLPDSETSYQLN